MTHTTTDAAEARALTVIQADRDAALETVTDDGSHSSYMMLTAISEGRADYWPLVQAFARHRLATAEAASGAGGREELAKLVAPFADYDGDLPDYDHPLRCVYESGVQYAVVLLAKTLDVKEWVPCDGTEEYDGDLGGTLLNIVLEAMPEDPDGDRIHPRELPALLASLPPATDPAMGLDPVTIERCAKVADRMATSTTVPEEANNAAWNLAIAIRALAAAPTIPVTGEAGQ